MTVLEFENAVRRLEKIRIVIRLPEKVAVPAYTYERPFDQRRTFADLKEVRFSGWLDGMEVIAIDGSGSLVDDDAVMSEIRASYQTDDEQGE